MPRKPIYVTQPFLPPLQELMPYLEKIWEDKVITNGGPFHQQLEEALCSYLGVKHIALFNNATIALITALKALHIGGEVITTPYSFVATSHSLLWNGIKPVFVDINQETLNPRVRHQMTQVIDLYSASFKLATTKGSIERFASVFSGSNSPALWLACR